ncbi:hypothetical protein H0H81_010044 [Sphagnurus paluster]|uniref:Uncharacterized protein n=1 Tax=Sphagnurus paluster TaxID=117069 RepID=A0A9P7FPC9_9AGAR|nr:hypothetical protein H0H81_010044 [Sphagnurus paluster]
MNRDCFSFPANLYFDDGSKMAEAGVHIEEELNSIDQKSIHPALSGMKKQDIIVPLDPIRSYQTPYSAALEIFMTLKAMRAAAAAAAPSPPFYAVIPSQMPRSPADEKTAPPPNNTPPTRRSTRRASLQSTPATRSESSPTSPRTPGATIKRGFLSSSTFVCNWGACGAQIPCDGPGAAHQRAFEDAVRKHVQEHAEAAPVATCGTRVHACLWEGCADTRSKLPDARTVARHILTHDM